MKKLSVLAMMLIISGCSLFNFNFPGWGTDEEDTPSITNSAVLGTYTVNENGSASGASTFTITITSGSSGTQILIDNFYGVFNNNVTGTMTNNTAFTITRQEPDTDGFFVVGSGSYSNGTLTMTYTVTDERDINNIISDIVTSTGSRL